MDTIIGLTDGSSTTAIAGNDTPLSQKDGLKESAQRATLPGLPIELCLQIFGCLIESPLWIDAQNTGLNVDSKEDWHNYHSLILTSRKLNLEVTDVFFENTSVGLDLAK